MKLDASLTRMEKYWGNIYCVSLRRILVNHWGDAFKDALITELVVEISSDRMHHAKMLSNINFADFATAVVNMFL